MLAPCGDEVDGDFRFGGCFFDGGVDGIYVFDEVGFDFVFLGGKQGAAFGVGEEVVCSDHEADAIGAVAAFFAEDGAAVVGAGVGFRFHSEPVFDVAAIVPFVWLVGGFSSGSVAGELPRAPAGLGAMDVSEGDVSVFGCGVFEGSAAQGSGGVPFFDAYFFVFESLVDEDFVQLPAIGGGVNSVCDGVPDVHDVA